MPQRLPARVDFSSTFPTTSEKSCGTVSASSSGFSKAETDPHRPVSLLTLTSIWRPISPAPVEDCPLALCDFRTVDLKDLVPMDIVYPHFVDEAYEVQYNPSHRWFFKKGMRQDDVIVFKMYDSLKSEATGEFIQVTSSKGQHASGEMADSCSVPTLGFS